MDTVNTLVTLLRMEDNNALDADLRKAILEDFYRDDLDDALEMLERLERIKEILESL